MASFFQSFGASLMPKQLLRFALSRLDLLDAQALDLENLDFALGRNTVLEFRDVGLVLQKLEKLLGLPPAFSLRKAKVLVLRVTVPMDFYTSPITVEVDGVDIRLRVTHKQAKDPQHAARRGKAAVASDVVPSAADLAQDFLETQPVAEKEELEQALAAESQDLAASLAVSEAGSDDSSAVGTGQGLSLPAFLTGFLQGIVDRMQIRVRHVTFQVDVEVPGDPGASAPELVTLQLSLDTINVEGVTSPGQALDEAPAFVPKEGKRHVLLDNIRAALISEANLFSSLAHSPSMPSSVASPSPVVAETSVFPMAGLAGSASSDSMAGAEDLSQSRYLQGDSEAAFNIPYDFGENNNPRQAGEPASPLSTPRASVHRDPPPAAVGEHAKSTVFEPSHAAWSTFEREAQSEPSLRPPEGFSISNVPSPAASFRSESSNGSSGDAVPEDLTQSHLYTHEEAESMYMSAFSQAESLRLRTGMPGAWDAVDDSVNEHGDDLSTLFAETPTALHLGNETNEHFAASSVQRITQEQSEIHDEGYPDDNATGLGGQQPAAEEFDPPQDDAPTPRGPTRLVKEIVSLDSVSIYLPSTHEHTVAAVPDLGKSISPNLPGAFSVHSAAAASPRLLPASEPPAEKLPIDPSIEVILKPIEVRFDASIGFLLAMVVGRLLEAARGESSEPAGSGSTAAKPTAKTPDFKVTVEQLSVLFLEKLAGVSDVPHRRYGEKATEINADILLQASLVNLQSSVSTEGPLTQANLTVEKLRLGYANDDIISFDRSVQMSESMASTFPSAGQDISVKATMSPDTSRIEINTLPLHVRLDLQRLDETFSWFGGLSSFLNMGASITSNASKGGKNPAKSTQTTRGVRFDEAVHPNHRTVAKENKTDLRINGLQVDVVGKDCSVVLNTSALKLVNREGMLGVHFSKIRLMGPYVKSSRAEAPIVAEIVDTRLEYLPLPRTKDLERLLELITPSKIKFDEDEDEIMVDTLLRQRRKGPVLSLTVGKVRVDAGNLQQLSCLPGLADDLAKLGTVAKYLPEDDRPGLLTLGHIKSVECRVDVGGRFGAVHTSLADLEVAHITVPALIAVAIGTATVTRNKIEELIGTSPAPTAGSSTKPPVLMMRLIDEIEPVLKLKLMGLSVEYRVTTIMDMLDLADDATPQDYEAVLAASVADLGNHAHAAIKSAPSGSPTPSKPIKLDLALRDCLIGLNPLGLPCKLTVVLTDAHLDVTPGAQESLTAVASLKRATLLLIDDVAILDSTGAPFAPTRRPHGAASPQVTELCGKGYVNICQISSAGATIKTAKDAEGETQLEVEVRDDLLVLETCADSTQTLFALFGALKPPTPPSKEVKYRTKVVPFTNLLSSLGAEAFGGAEGDYDFDNDFAIAQELGGSASDDSDFYGGSNDSPLHLNSHYYDEPAGQEELFDATSRSAVAGSTRIEDTTDGVLLSTGSIGPRSNSEVGSGSDTLSIHEDHFEQNDAARHRTQGWGAEDDNFDLRRLERWAMKVSVRDVHVIWHLFDGFDWVRTQEVIAKGVREVEAKALERRARAQRLADRDEEFEEDEAVISDCLFNSIYIGIPANRDPAELTRDINHCLHDFGETESVATTAATSTTARATGQHRRSRSLKLNRSRHHKITFELKGVNADMVVAPPGAADVVSAAGVRVNDLDIFDHMPESTWKKFATYDIDAGERELGASMVHIEFKNIRLADSPVTEMVARATILPLRLHVDQDAVDFLKRFFMFKDESVPVTPPSDVLFLRRVQVNSIPVKLDYKPKRVDYAGLRSGSTTEFMNFVTLEEARFVLGHVILYGIPGLDELGTRLHAIWSSDVTRNQLPGVLAGLAPVRSLANAGSGFRDLITIPIVEYRKDGRIVRSLKKGATAFAKTTGIEVVRLGAKLAIGTQNALQTAEGLLVPNAAAGDGPSSSAAATAAAGVGVLGDDFEEEYEEDGPRRKISLYAHQPLGVVQGMRSAYASLARDLAVARDAIIAVPAEVMESQSAQGAAGAVLRRAPTIILRPAIGATKAIGQTLLGATNSLDPLQRRRVEAKYKK
ncbi:c1f69c60-b4d1-44b3-b412-cc4d31eafdb7 [Thermothielavioides terrestris]|uniref:Autophagy-related protein 2 n=1 Tax=Thermothielavioides terrestris TaxID=2587410 RepID=A0A3S4B3P2_9PEZI|nr:c1f69c60-b4d1-44b3-b412-cc4d31eafdb7 [Thermothielavioides terrestris]